MTEITLGTLHEILSRVEVQVNKTNGTVRKHDKLINRFMGGGVVLMFILTAILIPLAFSFVNK